MRDFRLPRHQLGISHCCEEQVLEILSFFRRKLLATSTQWQQGKILLDLPSGIQKENVILGGSLGHREQEMVECMPSNGYMVEREAIIISGTE